jgi:4-amino-4-deoxy-L-arabinose transferase-like glycosyltransferase
MFQKYSLSKLIGIAILFYFVIAYILQLHIHYANANYISSDAYSYIAAAKKLYLQHHIDAERPPIIAALVGLPLLFNSSFSNFFVWYWCVQFVLLLCNVALVFKIGQLLFNNKMAFYIALCLAINISFIAYSNQILSEILFTSLLILATYYVVSYFKNSISKQLYLIAVLFILGLSCLVRPIIFPFVILIFTAAIIYFFSIKKYVFILFAIIAFVPVHLQCNAVQKITGSYQISTIGNAAILNYLDIRARNFENKSDYLVELKKQNFIRDSASQKGIVIMASTDFKYEVQTNFINVVKAYCYNLCENSFRGSAGITTEKELYASAFNYRINKILYQITALNNVVISVLALIILPIFILKNSKKIEKPLFKILLFLNALSVYIMLVSAISFFQRDRFHIVIVPLVLLMCGIIYNAYKSPQTQQAS